MARFNFDNLINHLKESDFQIPCKNQHQHNILIINPYEVDLYQAWTIEMARHFQARPNTNVLISSIGIPFLHIQRSVLRQIIVQASKLILRIFKNQQLRYLSPYNYSVKSNEVLKCLRNALRSAWSYFLRNSLTATKPEEEVKSKSLFSTLATKFGTVEFEIRRHLFQIFILNLAFEISYHKTVRMLNEVKPCLVITGNGRLVKAAAITCAAREREISVLIIERGAFPGTFDLYKISPHSIQERRQQAKELFENVSKENAERISKQYLELRKQFDPISGLVWQRNFESGKLPPLDSRKLCVCFTSTETEFAVFGDTFPSENFQSQEEAFRSLAESLNPSEWQIVIRRHPYGEKKIKSDPEQKLWKALSSFPHVRIVGPRDHVDSYALVQNAQLVAHYNSSMGPEAISIGACPVITMGPTLWEKPNSAYVTSTREKLRNFLGSNHQVRPESDVYVWSLYWATFGYKFSVVHWIENKGYINGKRLL